MSETNKNETGVQEETEKELPETERAGRDRYR